MNRKKQILIFVVIIPLLYLMLLRLGDYYLTPEGVFYACEKGLHYGPSEEILAEYELVDGGKLIVGKWDGNLSAIPAERAYGLLWQLKGGGVSGLIICDKVVSADLRTDGRVLGLTSDQQVKEVICQIEYDDYENPSVQEFTMTVDEGGYFTGIWKNQKQEYNYECIVYVEGRNSEGVVIYRDGMASVGKFYYDGVLNGTEGKRE